MTPKKAKEYSGYQEKPVLPVCWNCQAFTSEMQLPAWMEERNRSGERYTIEENGIEKNLRCSDHGFAIKKMASCNSFKAREQSGGTQ